MLVRGSGSRRDWCCAGHDRPESGAALGVHLECASYALLGFPQHSSGDWYNPGMTLVEVTYELQSPLSEQQLRQLGEFANTYGLRRFRLDDSKKQLSFEYDASRLRETQVVHALGQAKIAVAGRGIQLPAPR